MHVPVLPPPAVVGMLAATDASLTAVYVGFVTMIAGMVVILLTHPKKKRNVVSVYIDKKRIASKDPTPIIVDDRQGKVTYHSRLRYDGPMSLIYKPDHTDGSCLWMEMDEHLIQFEQGEQR